jgi:RNase P subunit RPR2
MKCPCCNKTLQIPSNIECNLESYHNHVVATTLCCGKLVDLYPISTYEAHKHEGPKTEDDWGTPAKKK